MISSKTRDRFPIEEIHEAMHNEFIEGKDFAPYQKTQISLEESLHFRFGENDFNDEELKQWIAQKI